MLKGSRRLVVPDLSKILCYMNLLIPLSPSHRPAKVHRIMLSKKQHYPLEETSLHQRVSPLIQFIWGGFTGGVDGLADFGLILTYIDGGKVIKCTLTGCYSSDIYCSKKFTSLCSRFPSVGISYPGLKGSYRLNLL